MLVLEFKDNGRGFDLEKVRTRIFGLYQRFHNNSDSKGVGLYLVHSQITSLGGSIEVDSEVDKGTTFTLRFKNKKS
jgi:signal transduction histidine kinase